jgi:succinyl-CoA synthetase beta subunit
VLTEYDAKRLLKAYGVPSTREVLCGSLSEAKDAAEEIGYPVALKVMSGDILHKTEAGVVALQLRNEEELRNAYGRLLEHAHTFAPHAHIQGVLVQEMVEEGLECLVGVKRDPLFGPMVAVGLGGIYVEVLKDLVLRKAPVSEGTALGMIEQLKGYPLLAGARGQKKRDIAALARLLRIVSEFACAEPDLLELDINPVFVRAEGEGVVAADALVLRRGEIA